MATLFRYVLLVVGGYTAGVVLAAPAVGTYPMATGFGPDPALTSGLAAAAVGQMAAVLAAARIRHGYAAAAAVLVGAALVGLVALPRAWRFDVYVSAIWAGMLLGGLVVLCIGAGRVQQQTVLAGGVVAGLWTAVPMAQYRQFAAAPREHAPYLAASTQPTHALWLVLAAATLVTAGLTLFAGGAGPGFPGERKASARELAVGTGLPALGVGLYWSFSQAAAALSTDSVEEGRWRLGMAAVPVTLAAALWLRERTGTVLLAALAVVLATGGAIAWAPDTWPLLAVPVLLVAAGAWLGRRAPRPLTGIGVLTLVAASELVERPPWDTVHLVVALVVAPAAAAYTLVACLPSTASVTATSLAVPAAMAVPLIARFGWATHAPLPEAAGAVPRWWTTMSVGVSVAAVLACGAAMAWLHRHRPDDTRPAEVRSRPQKE